ncbi:MAG: hypothetical protein AAF467_24610 [Actinomycetota bacterium]
MTTHPIAHLPVPVADPPRPRQRFPAWRAVLLVSFGATLPVTTTVVVLAVVRAPVVMWIANLFAIGCIVLAAIAWLIARTVYQPGDLHGAYLAAAAFTALATATGLALGGSTEIVFTPRALWLVVGLTGIIPNVIAHQRTATATRPAITGPTPARRPELAAPRRRLAALPPPDR